MPTSSAMAPTTASTTIAAPTAPRCCEAAGRFRCRRARAASACAPETRLRWGRHGCASQCEIKNLEFGIWNAYADFAYGQCAHSESLETSLLPLVCAMLVNEHGRTRRKTDPAADVRRRREHSRAFL